MHMWLEHDFFSPPLCEFTLHTTPPIPNARSSLELLLANIVFYNQHYDAGPCRREVISWILENLKDSSLLRKVRSTGSSRTLGTNLSFWTLIEEPKSSQQFSWLEHELPLLQSWVRTLCRRSDRCVLEKVGFLTRSCSFLNFIPPTSMH